MAFPCRTLLYAVSDFLILLLFLLIHESRSCPVSFNFYCPDNIYNGQLPMSLFTNRSPYNPYCAGGPCELTCDYHNKQTLIKCTENPERPYRVLDINPNNGTIVIEYPDWWLPPDDTKLNPCEVYSALNVSLPTFQLVYLANSWGKNETFFGCSPPIEDIPAACGSGIKEGELPAGTAGCMQFKYLSHKDDKNKGRRWKIILPSVFSVLAILLITLFIFWQQRKIKPGSTTFPSRITSLYHTRSDLEEGSINNGVIVFSYTELQQVTNNFDPDRELGEGGFGIVYHGKLNDGREVAVKRMYEKNYKQVEQFKNEIQILTNIRHQNLVTLYGSTSRHSRELLLVYEYIPNGTVADHLHGNQSKSVLLLWPTRFKIAIETATALSYLHYNDIIHRDIKTNNILLDRHFCAKVADFGLSRLFPADVTHVSTAPQGTPGYLDPEYHQCYHLTDKSDVFSFGVVLIELISSLPAIDMERQRHEVNLSNYAMNKIQCSALDELVDPNLGFEKSFKVRRMITLAAELAFQCLQHEREVRPSMEEVLEALKRIEGVDYDALEAEELGKKTSTTHITNQTPSPTDSDDVEL